MFHSDTQEGLFHTRGLDYGTIEALAMPLSLCYLYAEPMLINVQMFIDYLKLSVALMPMRAKWTGMFLVAIRGYLAPMAPNDVSLRFIYLAPAENVFDAWTKEELIRKWLFVGPTSEIVKVDIDLKVNGKFSILEFERTTNDFIDHYGEYLAITRPSKLAFTLSVPKHFPGETRVVLEITPKGESSELTLFQSGVSKDVTEESWKKMLKNLKLTLEGH